MECLFGIISGLTCFFSAEKNRVINPSGRVPTTTRAQAFGLSEDFRGGVFLWMVVVEGSLAQGCHIFSQDNPAWVSSCRPSYPVASEMSPPCGLFFFLFLMQRASHSSNETALGGSVCPVTAFGRCGFALELIALLFLSLSPLRSFPHTYQGCRARAVIMLGVVVPSYVAHHWATAVAQQDCCLAKC